MPDQRQRGIWGVQHQGGAQHACQQEQPKARLCSHSPPRCLASVVCVQQASHERHATHSHVSCGRRHRAKILLTLLSSLLTIQPGTGADECLWIQQRAQEQQIQEATNALCQSEKAVGDDVVSVTEAGQEEQAERFQCHKPHHRSSTLPNNWPRQCVKILGMFAVKVHASSTAWLGCHNNVQAFVDCVNGGLAKDGAKHDPQSSTPRSTTSASSSNNSSSD